MRVAVSVCCSLFLLSACAQRGPTVARDGSPDAKAGPQTAEDCDRAFAERLNAGDIDGLVALYEPTGTLVRQNGTPATGTAAIREELGGIVALEPTIVMNVKRSIAAGDVVVLYNDWTATGTDPKGKRMKISGRASEIVRRQADGSWRFVIDDPDARGRR